VSTNAQHLQLFRKVNVIWDIRYGIWDVRFNIFLKI
jgi:hypothetical protein